MIWLKLVHLAAISIWAAGLACLPGLYLQRVGLDHEASIHRLHAMARYLYVVVVSPAAFIAVSSGTALIFLRATYETWFAVKLSLVGIMVGLHLVTGMFIVQVFGERNLYPSWRFVTLAALTLFIVIAILVVVLAKPQLPALLPAALSEPGGLRNLMINLFQR